MPHIKKPRIDLPWLQPGSWPACLLAIALVAAATLVRMSLGPLIFNMPFITFYPAVFLAAFLGGTASGFLAAALAMLAGWFLFMPPGYSAQIRALGLPHPLVLFAMFTVSGVTIVGALHATLARLRKLTAAQRAHDAGEFQRLADALHNAAFALVIVDAKTSTIQYANPAYAALRGMTVEQLRNPHVVESYAPADRPRIRALIESADRTGRVTIEAEYASPDGSVLPVQIDITSVRSPTGEVLYRIGTTQDITERRRAETMAAALHALDERLRQILDETPIGMVLLTPDTHRYVWVNATMSRMLEYTADELIGRRRDDFVHPDDPVTPIAEARGAVPQWQPTERRIVAKSGRNLYVRSRVVRLGPDAAGQDLLLGLAEDVTRHRQVEAALRQAQKMEAVGNLAGGMAHDFNNLLGVIIGNLDIIASLPTENPAIAELVKDATDAALRGADLTRNLLAFARRQPLQPVQLPINAVINDITRLLARVLREDVTITLDLSPDVWSVIADRGMLEASIVNLASNARDAMPRGGTLRIATANRRIDTDYAAMHQEMRPGDYVMIEVTDTGAGMAPEVINRIYEPFFTTKAAGKGSGLGLSMVFGFISQSGGHISVDSEPGSGTTFRLLLPRAVTDETPTTSSPESALPLASKGETVLVVEDNAALRRIAVRQLTELGYTVFEADNADAALRQLRCTPVHVLFTDVVMPGGMDGFELAQLARKVQPDIKVLLTSGFPEHATDRPLDPIACAMRLLHKPYRAEDLARGMLATLHG